MNDLVFKPNTWLENAGIVGLMRILRQDQYKVVRTKTQNGALMFELRVKSDAIDGFTSQYFNYFIETYGKYTRYQKILDDKSYLLELKDNDYQNADLNRLTNYFNTTIKYSLLGTMKSFKQIADYLGDDIQMKAKGARELEKVLTQKKTQNDSEMFKSVLKEFVERLLNIIAYFETDKARMYYQSKLLGYSIIQNAWNNKSFLDSANMKKLDPDLFGNFDKTFIRPIQDYLVEDHDGDKFKCVNCGNTFKKKSDGIPITFLNGMGYDFGKKRSNGWNLLNDLYICPICQLMYVSIPAGFAYNMNHQGLFINQTHNLDVLKRINDQVLTRLTKDLDTHNNVLVNKALMNAYKQELVLSNKSLLKNAQIVNYYNEHYSFQNVSSLATTVLNQASDCVLKSGKTLIQSLMPIGISNFNGINYFSIYDEMLKRIFNNTELSDLIYLLERLKVSNVQDVYCTAGGIMHVIELNAIMLNQLWKRQGVKEMRIDDETLRKVRGYGMRIREGYATKANAKKSQALAYKMLEALRTNDLNHFMDLMLTAYLYLGQIAPSIFVNEQSKPDVFKQYGYAFIAGLIGNDQKKENNQDKEE